ncbi:glutamate:Na+ symporter, ESS family [Corynebacterium appendicis CIP 107643]|uniref:Glutamate:Na+ symporter, ESS family n=1 Tax=Corynebacterium appendicis CIP 107643 TaxID=1161099 RepID=A0A1N7J801_9CORY|nr:sodium/glutamate symporter [Corynebacterium appendicis]WJY61936.1 Sodium/glutamate symporter [Corynebacterium appendicis CIP 107643]SIS45498.1 glutamate:Na+ symporter, ESS family [Corynebacterium appendicis CIP 107643]
MEFTPYDMLVDVGWISVLLIVGNILRQRVRVLQQLLLPAPITAGLIGLVLGPEVLDLVPFSDKIGDYTSILIAVVFASMAYSMDLGGSVAKGARNMWAFSTTMFMFQWGLFVLAGIYLFKPVFGTEDWFGMMLPVGFVGGFGTAAAVGSALEDTAGAVAASSLGFTSATVGTLVAIIGGVIVSNWGIRKGKATELQGDLPKELRSGYIEDEAERPSIGKATTNPSSIEPLALHGGFIIFTVLVANLVKTLISNQWENVSIPLFALSFVIGFIGRGLLRLFKKPNYLDKDTVSAISGAATDYMIAFGIASIAPAALAAYWQALILLFVLGTVFCLFYLLVMAPLYFGEQWIERGIFGWGWATAAVATGIALLKMVDPKLKSGTLNEYGVAYVGFGPFEIVMTILAPIAVLASFTGPFGWVSTAVAAGILVLSFALKWVPAKKDASAPSAGASGGAASA